MLPQHREFGFSIVHLSQHIVNLEFSMVIFAAARSWIGIAVCRFTTCYGKIDHRSSKFTTCWVKIDHGNFNTRPCCGKSTIEIPNSQRCCGKWMMENPNSRCAAANGPWKIQIHDMLRQIYHRNSKATTLLRQNRPSNLQIYDIQAKSTIEFPKPRPCCGEIDHWNQINDMLGETDHRNSNARPCWGKKAIKIPISRRYDLAFDLFSRIFFLVSRFVEDG